MTFIQMPEEPWSDAEEWAWQEIRAGRIADFNASEGREKPLDSKTSNGWGEKRKLRSDFLKQILFRKPSRSEIPIEGVRIVGAWFTEGIELEHGRLARQLWLENCRFEGPAKLAGLQIDGWFSLEGSTFAEQGTGTTSVDLNGANITGLVSLKGVTVTFIDVDLTGVDLTGARVGGQLNLSGAKFDGKLNMDGLDVGQPLLMGEDATFKEVILLNAKVGGQLNLNKATLKGGLDMRGLDVAQHLLMGGGAKFKDVDLTAAKVGGQLNLNDAEFDGKLNIDSLAVEGDIFMKSSTFKKMVRLIFTRVGRSLDLSNSKLSGLDLSGTRIEGELNLGSNLQSRTRWHKGAALNLRNVHIGALQDRRDRVAKQWVDAWPDELQLDGFTYDRLGGFGGMSKRVGDLHGDSDVDMQARDIHWYIDWLDRDRSYSPQPYEQLAGVFRAAGDPTKANRILYASRRRARREARRQGQYFRWLGYSILDWTIGYGLGGRYFRALAWVIAFTILGTCLLYFSGQPNAGLAAGLPARLIYSLDQLLPIVEFEKYDKVVLTGAIAYYFYAQKLIGWALGSFLVAGLAGLTQKQ